MKYEGVFGLPGTSGNIIEADLRYAVVFFVVFFYLQICCLFNFD